MKKNLIVAAVSASFAIAAHAQSSVTLYGLLDAGVQYTSNVGGNSNWQQTSGGIDQSRFGLKGSEDLGGGLKAVFNLESGFNVNNGAFANTGMFNRQAFVGLSSGYGTVTLGRQFDSMQDFLAPLTATGSWGGTNFAHFGNFDNLSTASAVGANNTIKFTSANYSGLTFGGTYSFSNQSQFANNREYSTGAMYQNQGLRIGAAFAQRNNPLGENTDSVKGSSNGSNIGSFTSTLTAGMTAPRNFRERTYGAGAGYTFGPAEVGVAWTQARLDNSEIASLAVRQDNYEVNAKYNLTPALGLGAAYTYTNQEGSLAGNNVKQRFHQFGMQADYSLSKRTDVYAQAVYQHAMGDVKQAAIFNGAGANFSNSENQTVATVGLRHRF